MKQRIWAILLSGALCLSLFGTAFADWQEVFDDNGVSQGWHEMSPETSDPEPPNPGTPTGPSTPSNSYDNYIPSTSTSSNTTTVTNPDGSTTTTKKGSDGTVTTTTKTSDGGETKEVVKPDGTKQVEVKEADGTTATANVSASGKVDASVKVSDKAVNDANGAPVALPVPSVPVTSSSAAASTVKVDLPDSAAGKDAYVSVPVENAGSGTVAVIVKADGTEEIVKKSLLVGGNMVVPLEGDATLKIVDKSKTFTDTQSHWSVDAVSFVASRELFDGVGGGQFAPDVNMTRGMLVTVLHRLENTPASGSANFIDVPDTWYTQAVAWASGKKIVDGYGNGAFGPDDNITREQIAVILYRYAAAMGIQTAERSLLTSYIDGANTSAWAQEAMSWAVGAGLFRGDVAGYLNPGNNATRAEVATLLMRFVEYMAK